MLQPAPGGEDTRHRRYAAGLRRRVTRRQRSGDERNGNPSRSCGRRHSPARPPGRPTDRGRGTSADGDPANTSRPRRTCRHHRRAGRYGSVQDHPAGARQRVQGQRRNQNHPRQERNLSREDLHQVEPCGARRRGSRRDEDRVRRAQEELARDASERLGRRRRQYRRRRDGRVHREHDRSQQLREPPRRPRPPVRHSKRWHRDPHHAGARPHHRRRWRHAEPVEHRQRHVLSRGLRLRGVGRLRVSTRLVLHHRFALLRPKPDGEHLARRQQGQGPETGHPTVVVRRRARLSPGTVQPRRAVLRAGQPLLRHDGRPSNLPPVRRERLPVAAARVLREQPAGRDEFPLVRRQPRSGGGSSARGRHYAEVDVSRTVGP